MTPQTWLITGGAGYIGSHIADLFLDNNKEVVIYDSLYQGLESRIEYLRKKHGKEIPLIVADIRDSTKFEEVIETCKPDGVIHTAALKAVGESMQKPDEYFEVNHASTVTMLEILIKHKIQNFIFSSTAAVYGSPDHLNLIKEDDPKNPISPYGASKLSAEREVNKFLAFPDKHGTSLRFFNVIGTAAPELMDNSVENLVPTVIKQLHAGQLPMLYGTDYPTPDGTCVRDYIDVRDVAAAHLAVADFEGALPQAMNVGTGKGASVREVIKLVCGAARKGNITAIEQGRRFGDPAFLCADSCLISSVIGFKSQLKLDESIASLLCGSDQ
jgi:UDP-glucose 4-epimerase